MPPRQHNRGASAHERTPDASPYLRSNNNGHHSASTPLFALRNHPLHRRGNCPINFPFNRATYFTRHWTMQRSERSVVRRSMFIRFSSSSIYFLQSTDRLQWLSAVFAPHSIASLVQQTEPS